MIYFPETFYTSERLNGQDLQERFKEGRLIAFTVSHWDSEKKALVVKFEDGITGYLPEEEVCMENPKFNSYLSLSIQANSLIGHTACALITNIQGDTVLLSRKKLQQEALTALKVGSIYNVQIKSITAIGLFVDIGVGIVGFIHNSQISKTKFNDISDLETDLNLYRGKVIRAKLTSADEYIKLSFRQAFNFPVLLKGDTVFATVRNRLYDDSGYFVEITPNDTAIVDTDRYLAYGSRILVQIKSTENFCEEEDYFNQHHVTYVC